MQQVLASMALHSNIIPLKGSQAVIAAQPNHPSSSTSSSKSAAKQQKVLRSTCKQQLRYRAQKSRDMHTAAAEGSAG